MRRIYALVIGVALLVAIPGVAVAAPSSRSAVNQQAVDLVIDRGLSQRGVPFSYGGGDANGPTRGSGTPENVAGLNPEGRVVGLDPAVSTVGFDASGLMVYSFAGIGVKLPRSSGAQYNVGQKVLPSEALPGDLIFYGPQVRDHLFDRLITTLSLPLHRPHDDPVQCPRYARRNL